MFACTHKSAMLLCRPSMTGPTLYMKFCKTFGMICRSGDYPLAQSLYEKCRLQDPFDVRILSNLAAVYLKLHDWTKALTYAQNVLKMSPDHVKCLYRYGVAAMHLQEYNKAVCTLQSAQKLVRLNSAYVSAVLSFLSIQHNLMPTTFVWT